MEVLARKLEQELAHDARVIACRFPFPHWHASASVGQGLDQAWAYDMAKIHKLPFSLLPNGYLQNHNF